MEALAALSAEPRHIHAVDLMVFHLVRIPNEAALNSAEIAFHSVLHVSLECCLLPIVFKRLGVEVHMTAQRARSLVMIGPFLLADMAHDVPAEKLHRIAR